MNYYPSDDIGRDYRIVKKELRRLFRLYPTLSEKDIDIAINFFIDYFDLDPNVKLGEFKLRVINRLIKDQVITKDKELGLFQKVQTDEIYSEEIPLIFRFNLYLISLHKKGRIRFQDGFYIYEEGQYRGIIFSLPHLSRKHPYYLQECISIIKANLKRKHLKIYLFKNEASAINTIKVLINDGIHFNKNNLFLYNETNQPSSFVPFRIKKEAYKT